MAGLKIKERVIWINSLIIFDSRHRESMLKKPSGEDGPVITISRQTGCDARQVAERQGES